MSRISVGDFQITLVRAGVYHWDGGALFGANVPDAWRLDATAQIAPVLGGASVRMMIQPLLANQIVIGGTPRSRLPQLIGLLISNKLSG